jgi:ubiquinone/menaquinone biosynthesis C-methylase UbiE
MVHWLRFFNRKYHRKKTYGIADSEKAVRQVLYSILDKTLLEVACGSAELSLEASQYARSVTAIDTDLDVSDEALNRENFKFRLMDASEIEFPDASFDVVVIFNALARIKDKLDAILAGCRRVLEDDGEIIIISTAKKDKILLYEFIPGQAQSEGKMSIVKMKK